jgi:hypothetical protein
MVTWLLIKKTPYQQAQDGLVFEKAALERMKDRRVRRAHRDF